MSTRKQTEKREEVESGKEWKKNNSTAYTVEDTRKAMLDSSCRPSDDSRNVDSRPHDRQSSSGVDEAETRKRKTTWNRIVSVRGSGGEDAVAEAWARWDVR